MSQPVLAADGGRAAVDNGAGLCEACNYAKEAPGWVTNQLPSRVLGVTTPTGHRYVSRPPPAFGHNAGHTPSTVSDPRVRSPLAS